MKYIYSLAILGFILFASSCRKDFETIPSSGNLTFSKDTVYLDTVFTNIGSSTYNLRVYNKSSEDISIPVVKLANGEGSSYRLNVDGIPGKYFENVQILAKDSIYIFIETTVDIQDVSNSDVQFLYTDKIIFDSGSNQQDVDLVTLVKDAVFLYPEQFADGTTETLVLGQDEEGNDIEIYGFFLDDTELHFTNEKPYVIYGYAAVPSNKTLQIDPGARIHFHADSGIIVANQGSIKANGAPSTDPEMLEGEIIFEGDRLEPVFSDVPGQWGTLWLTDGSTNNEFSYTTIKNSLIGILMDNNDGDRTLTLKNVQIYNSAVDGLQARTGDVYGENVVISNSGQSSLSCLLGGRYTFKHSTFSNYWANSFRSFPSVQVSNALQVGDQVFVSDLFEANFENCIIYGSESREISLYEETGASFNFSFTHSLIRFEDPNGDFENDVNYDFSNTNFYLNCVFNEDPVFQDTSANNFNIETGTSAADGIGDPTTASQVPVDLNNITRNLSAPDAGAYETTIFPDEGG